MRYPQYSRYTLDTYPLPIPPHIYEALNTMPSLDEITRVVWIVSHFITFFGTISYPVLCIAAPTGAVVVYTFVSLAAIVTYALVLHRKYFLRNFRDHRFRSRFHHNHELQTVIASLIPLSVALKSENFHLMALAALWLVTPAQFFKLVPFAIYSYLNILQFVHERLIHRYVPGLHSALGPLIRYLRSPLLQLASIVELLLFPIIFVQSAINGSLYAWFLYATIWMLKTETSVYTKRGLYSILGLMDHIFLQPTVPPHVVRSYFLARNTFAEILPLRNRKALGDASSIVNLAL